MIFPDILNDTSDQTKRGDGQADYPIGYVRCMACDLLII